MSDFFYYSNTLPNIPTDCSPYKITITDTNIEQSCVKDPTYSPNGTHTNDAFYCYQRELCKNKQLTDNIVNMSYVNSGSEIRYDDFEKSMKRDILYSFNLGMGILFTSIFIYNVVSK
jgi:hypothetical protein